MKLTVLSDTHGLHERLGKMPGGDLLIFAGDMSNAREGDSTADTLAFLARQPYEQIVVVPGNHDFRFAQDLQTCRNLALKLRGPDLHILQGTSVQVGNFTVHGLPWTTTRAGWAFHAAEQELARHCAAIPPETGILVTHMPPRGVLDTAEYQGQREHLGSSAIAQVAGTLLQLRLHVFGHTHDHGGQMIRTRHVSVNAALLKPKRQLREPVHLTL